MSENRVLQPPSSQDTASIPRDESGAPARSEATAPTSGRGRLLMRDSFIYLIGNLMQKAVAFVLIPLYTHALTTAQYGLLELANTVVNLLLLVAAIGVPSALNKCYHRDCADEAARGRLLGTALLFTGATTLALALSGWALEGRVAGLIFSGPEGPRVYRYTLVWLVLAQIAVIPFEWTRAAGRSVQFVGLSLTQLAVQFVCIVILVRWAGLGLAGVLAGNVAGLMAINLLGLFLLARRMVPTIDRRLFVALASYGLAMIPVFISSWIVNVSDRFFVQSLVGLSALGVYALGYKFGALVDLLLVMPFQRAWTPLFFRMAGEPQAPRALAKVTTYLMAGLSAASLAVSLGVPPLLRIIATPDFRGASAVVPVICLAYLLGGLATCLGNGLIVAGRVRLIAALAAVVALVNLGLNVLLIPAMGIYGAAVATVLAFGVQLGGMLLALRKHYPVPLEWGRMAGLAAACLIPFGASCALPELPLGADIAARLILLAACPVLIVLLRLARPEETEALRRGLGRLALLKSARPC